MTLCMVNEIDEIVKIVRFPGWKDTGHLIWSALGPKTMELVRENITAIGIKENMAVLEADADVIEQFINDKEKSKKAAKKIEISIAAIIRGHLDNPEFISLGERLEKLRKQHEEGLLFGAAFLKALLDLAKDTAAAVKKAQSETPEPPKEEKGKAALTELFNSVKNSSTPIIVERMKISALKMLRKSLSTSRYWIPSTHWIENAEVSKIYISVTWKF